MMRSLSRSRQVVGLIGLLGLLAIGASTVIPSAPPAAAPAKGAAESGLLQGHCEASAILAWEGGYIVGDNESSDRLYRLGPDLEPLDKLALSHEVEDIEALVQGPGGELIVVGSQSANKKGRPQPERERVLVLGSGPVRPDLSACRPCEEARGRPPKEGGLSIEGAASWRGSLYLGLRSPLVDSEAILLQMNGDPGRSLAVQSSRRLDLGGLGIRDLIPHGPGLLVLAGPADGGGEKHRLYRLDAPDGPPILLPVELPSGAEGLVVEGGNLLVVVDGDGKPGEPCREPARWIRLPGPVGLGGKLHEG